MSIDNFIWVPAGVRDDKNIGYRKYKSWFQMISAETSSVPRHQVFLLHGANVAIEEKYYFEDPDDARWFWAEGYNERLFLVDEGEGESAGYDRMSFWIDSALVAQRDMPITPPEGHSQALAEEPRDKWNPAGSLTTGELSRCAHGIGAEESTSSALRRLCERGLVREYGWGRYRLNPDLTVTK